MRRSSLLSAATLAVAAPCLFIPAADAGTRSPIEFTDHRVGLDQSSVTTSLAECPTAVAVDLKTHFRLTRTHGVFTGTRDIQCGDGTGFVVRLTANFNEEGSWGSWSIVSSYGDLKGMRGAGKLVGTPFDSDTPDPSDDGIDDHYTGTITRTR